MPLIEGKCKKVSDFSRKIQSYLWTLICVLVFVYYFMLITIEYTNYDVVTRVILADLHELEIPHVSLGFDLIDSLVDNSESEEHLAGKCRQAENRNLSCLQQLYTISSDQLLRDSLSYKDFVNEVTTDREIYTPEVKEFLKDNQKCFRLTIKKRNSTSARNQIRISLQNNISSRYVHVYLSAPNTYPREMSTKILKFDRYQNFSVFVEIERVDITRLTYPFATNCRFYNQEGYESQNHCIEECLARNQSGSPTFTVIKNIPAKLTLSARLDEACFNKCRQMECQSFMFAGDEGIYTEAGDSLQIKIEERYPAILISYNSLITLELYLIYVAGLLGPCFGFAFINLHDQIRNIIVKGKSLFKALSCVNSASSKSSCSKAIFTCFAVIGWALQSYQISTIYFDHEIASETFIGRPQTAVIPNVSICYDIVELLKNHTEAYRICQRDQKSCLNYLYAKYTAIEIDALTYSCTDLSVAAKTVDPAMLTTIYNDSSMGNFVTKHVQRTFFQFDKKCFLIHLFDGLHKIQMHLLAGNVIASVDMATSKQSRTYIRYNIEDSYENDAGSQKSWQRDNEVFVYFVHTEQWNLPYKSITGQCIDYTKFGCANRNVCVARCLSLGLNENSDTNATSRNFVVAANSNVRISPKHVSRKLLDKCNHRFPWYDCHEVTYNAGAIGSKLQTRTNSVIAFFMLRKRIYQKLMLEVSLVDYVTYIASIAGFWFTFSFLQIPEIINVQKFAHHILHIRLTRAAKRNSFLILFMLSTVAMLCNLQSVLSQYFGYAMLTNTIIESPSVINSKDITICIYSAYLVNRSSLNISWAPNCGQTSAFYDPKCLLDFANLTAAQRNEISFSFEDWIDTIDIRSIDSINWVHFDSSNLTKLRTDTFFFGGRKCFKIGSPVEGHYENKLLQYSDDRDIFKATLKNPSRRKEVFAQVLLTYNGHFARNSNYDFAFIFTNSLISFSYSVMRAYLLPYPYKTNCINYSQVGLESQMHCVQSCYRDEYLKTFGRVTGYSIVFDGPYDIGEGSQNWTMYARCLKKCNKADCDSVVFLKAEATSKENTSRGFVLKAPLTVTSTTYWPKMYLTEFIIYIGGIVGLYYGIDILSLPTTAKNIWRESKSVFERDKRRTQPKSTVRVITTNATSSSTLINSKLTTPQAIRSTSKTHCLSTSRPKSTKILKVSLPNK